MWKFSTDYVSNISLECAMWKICQMCLSSELLHILFNHFYVIIPVTFVMLCGHGISCTEHSPDVNGTARGIWGIRYVRGCSRFTKMVMMPNMALTWSDLYNDVQQKHCKHSFNSIKYHWYSSFQSHCHFDPRTILLMKIYICATGNSN